MFIIGDFSASTDVLMDMVGKMQYARVTMVHQMPYTTDQSVGLAAAVEKVFSNK